LRRVFIIGHRGAPVEAPENTIPSFIKAIESGADFIEIDVRSTKDGVLIVLHDSGVDRTTNGSGPVSEMMFSEVRRLDAGGWFSEKYRGVTIPSFDEVLDIAEGRIGIAVEIKTAGIEGEIVDKICERGLEDDVIILSSIWSSLRKVKRLNPRLTVMADLPNPIPEKLREAMGTYANLVSIHKSRLDKRFVQYCHRRGLLVNTWPINTVEEFTAAVEKEADFITTDNPALLVSILKQGFESK